MMVLGSVSLYSELDVVGYNARNTSPREYSMQSFPYWLLAALAVGALIGSVLRPGLLEIIIVWSVAAALYSTWRRISSRRRLAERLA